MSGDDNNIGRLVAGRYRLDKLLGRGGFGSVYRGWDAQIGRDVAVKLLDVGSKARSSSQEVELRERFRREAMAAGRINHPCVVTVFDFGVPDNGREAYLIMELLEGHDLGDELSKRGPLLPQRAVKLFVPLLAGLGRGHELGIVHKDIKPQNIFLRAPGTPQEALCLVDFGVARVVHEDKLTLTGLIVGTPQYMAPEYITETQVSPALDIYQMGLLLAESITGTPAVPLGETFVKSCNRHFTGDLDIPAEIFEGAFGAVLRKSLEPNPRQRYQNGSQFSAALAEVDGSGVGIGIEMKKTTVFRRSERAPTFDEPPLFPPMRPEEVSAELERLERDPSAKYEGPANPMSSPRYDAATEQSQPAILVNEAKSSGPRHSLRTSSDANMPNPYAQPTAPVRAVVAPPVRVPASTPMAPGAQMFEPVSDSLGDGPSAGFESPATEPPENWHWGNEPSEIVEDVASPSQKSHNVGLLLVAVVLCVLLFGATFAALQLIRETPGAESTPVVAAPVADELTPSPPVPAVAIEAEPVPTLQLDSQPSGAEVVVNGTVAGTTPHRLDLDTHPDAKVELRLRGHETQSVAVAPGKQLVKLVPVRREPPPKKAKRPTPKRQTEDSLSEERRRALLEAAANIDEPSEPAAAEEPVVEEPVVEEPAAEPEKPVPPKPARWD